mmetsp:Transcript_12912/g.42598  ORF Transcript_12912/g.42598 Transcript_12912/m.42598 type:complete len:248 (-) Transcript_12912:327-1070(-)
MALPSRGLYGGDVAIFSDGAQVDGRAVHGGLLHHPDDAVRQGDYVPADADPGGVADRHAEAPAGGEGDQEAVGGRRQGPDEPGDSEAVRPQRRQHLCRVLPDPRDAPSLLGVVQGAQQRLHRRHLHGALLLDPKPGGPARERDGLAASAQRANPGAPDRRPPARLGRRRALPRRPHPPRRLPVHLHGAPQGAQDGRREQGGGAAAHRPQAPPLPHRVVLAQRPRRAGHLLARQQLSHHLHYAPPPQD